MPSMYSDSVRAFLRPILPFLDDASVTEILVNGHNEIWIERSGKVVKSDAQFTEEGLLAATRNIAQFVGRVLNEERPRLDARLPDGSRIHIVLPPIARHGAILAIRKFSKDAMSMPRLKQLGTLSEPVGRLIEAAMKLHLNVIVAGGSGSGKTSFLNVISTFIEDEERVVTIEDSAELQLQQSNIIALESRPPDKFGKGEVTLADLLNSALRLRPDRIIVGEVRGGEALSLLQAMNTGHSGSMCTTHANTPVDTLRRLETLCLMSGIELPMVAVRAQTASAVHLVVCCERFSDGTRKVTHVSEVLPLNEHGEYRAQDLFLYVQTGKDEKTGKILGHHAPTGVLPTFFPRLAASGIRDIDEWFFDPATYDQEQPAAFRADGGDQTHWAPTLRPRAPGEPAPKPPKHLEEVPATPAIASPPPPPPPPPEVAEEEPVEEPVEEPAPAPEPEPPPPPKAVEPPPPATKPAPRPPPRDEPSIQVSADLLAEMQEDVAGERTRVGQNPLHDLTTLPPPARSEEDKTDPNIRVPHR